MFPKLKLILMKDLQRVSYTTWVLKTGEVTAVTKLLKEQSFIPKPKQAVNICSWCKHNHRKYAAQSLRYSRNYLQTGSYIENGLSEYFLSRLHQRKQTIDYQRRNLVTKAKATGPSTVSMSASSKPRRVGRIKQTQTADVKNCFLFVFYYCVLHPWSPAFYTVD